MSERCMSSDAGHGSGHGMEQHGIHEEFSGEGDEHGISGAPVATTIGAKRFGVFQPMVPPALARSSNEATERPNTATERPNTARLVAAATAEMERAQASSLAGHTNFRSEPLRTEPLAPLLAGQLAVKPFQLTPPSSPVVAPRPPAWNGGVELGGRTRTASASPRIPVGRSPRTVLAARVHALGGIRGRSPRVTPMGGTPNTSNPSTPADTPTPSSTPRESSRSLTPTRSTPREASRSLTPTRRGSQRSNLRPAVKLNFTQLPLRPVLADGQKPTPPLTPTSLPGPPSETATPRVRGRTPREGELVSNAGVPTPPRSPTALLGLPSDTMTPRLRAAVPPSELPGGGFPPPPQQPPPDLPGVPPPPPQQSPPDLLGPPSETSTPRLRALKKKSIHQSKTSLPSGDDFGLNLESPFDGEWFEGVQWRGTIKGNMLQLADSSTIVLEVRATPNASVMVVSEGQECHGQLDVDNQRLLWDDGDVWTKASSAPSALPSNACRGAIWPTAAEVAGALHASAAQPSVKSIAGGGRARDDPTWGEIVRGAWAPILGKRRFLKNADIHQVCDRFRALRAESQADAKEEHLTMDELAQILGVEPPHVLPLFRLLSDNASHNSVGCDPDGEHVNFRLLLVAMAGLTKAKLVERMHFAALLLDDQDQKHLDHEQLALILRANAHHTEDGLPPPISELQKQALDLIKTASKSSRTYITRDEFLELVRSCPNKFHLHDKSPATSPIKPAQGSVVAQSGQSSEPRANKKTEGEIPRQDGCRASTLTDGLANQPEATPITQTSETSVSDKQRSPIVAPDEEHTRSGFVPDLAPLDSLESRDPPSHPAGSSGRQNAMSGAHSDPSADCVLLLSNREQPSEGGSAPLLLNREHPFPEPPQVPAPPKYDESLQDLRQVCIPDLGLVPPAPQLPPPPSIPQLQVDASLSSGPGVKNRIVVAPLDLSKVRRAGDIESVPTRKTSSSIDTQAKALAVVEDVGGTSSDRDPFPHVQKLDMSACTYKQFVQEEQRSWLQNSFRCGGEVTNAQHRLLGAGSIFFLLGLLGLGVEGAGMGEEFFTIDGSIVVAQPLRLLFLLVLEVAGAVTLCYFVITRRNDDGDWSDEEAGEADDLEAQKRELELHHPIQSATLHPPALSAKQRASQRDYRELLRVMKELDKLSEF